MACQFFGVESASAGCTRFVYLKINVKRADKPLNDISICPNTIIKCKNKINECKFEDKRSFVTEHEPACEFRLIPCELCKKDQVFNKYNYHIDNICPKKEIECKIQCGATFLRECQSEHFKTVCPEFEIDCKFYSCNHKSKRKLMNDHYISCIYRNQCCQYCSMNMQFYQYEEHLSKICPDYPINCIQNCSQIIERKRLNQHIDSDCPNTIISCLYKNIGCFDKFIRKEFNQHMNDKSNYHIQLSIDSLVYLKKEYNELQQQVKDLKEKNNDLSIKLQKTENCLINEIKNNKYEMKSECWMALLNAQ
jgi:TNF receptor-associated factor 4